MVTVGIIISNDYNNKLKFNDVIWKLYNVNNNISFLLFDLDSKNDNKFIRYVKHFILDLGLNYSEVTHYYKNSNLYSINAKILSYKFNWLKYKNNINMFCKLTEFCLVFGNDKSRYFNDVIKKLNDNNIKTVFL